MIKSGIIVPILVLIPNLVWMILPKGDAGNASQEPIILTVIENVGRFACILIPVFYSIQWYKKFSLPVLIIMGISLLVYYVAWLRYFTGGREAALMSKPLLGIPLPLATAPILFFLLSSYLLDSWWMFAASIVFGTAHIWISATTF